MRNFLLISFFICLGFIAHAEVAVPSLNSRVTDLTKTLTAEQTAHIDEKLATLEKTKGSQVSILIILTTEPETIEDFSFRVVDKWKLGRKNIDDGILLTIAKNDRKIRIEVGDGLEGVITDVSAGRIINEYITPEFRQGRFYEGILAGIGQIENLIKGEPLPAPTTSQGDTTDIGATIPFMVMASALFSPFLASIFGRIVTVLVISVGGAVFVWLTSQDITLTIFSVVFLSIFSFVFTAPRSSSYRDGGGHGGGFGGGGFSGGSSGGFSGGGGGFSGGGASGGW